MTEPTRKIWVSRLLIPQDGTLLEVRWLATEDEAEQLMKYGVMPRTAEVIGVVEFPEHQDEQILAMVEARIYVDQGGKLL